MKLRTEIKVKLSENNVDYKSQILNVGSCFAQHIGEKLADRKFKILINPVGIIYNPFSIAQSLNFIVEGKKYTEVDLVYHNELWHSWYHHGQFSGSNKKALLNKINEQQIKAARFIKSTSHIMLTFGTAYVYSKKSDKVVVANCHKIKETEFNRKLISVEDGVNSILEAINAVRKINPDVKVILTVSPIRHWKDGAEGNQVSKSILLLMCHKLKKQINDVEYFPAYELIMDDLRDYRFYKNDMLHPNSLAINYVWQKFSEAYINKATGKIVNEVEKVIKAVKHRVQHPDTKAHKSFINHQLALINQLESKYELSFNEERASLI